MERLVANYKTMPMQTLIDNTLLPTPALTLRKSWWGSMTLSNNVELEVSLFSENRVSHANAENCFCNYCCNELYFSL